MEQETLDRVVSIIDILVDRIEELELKIDELNNDVGFLTKRNALKDS
jgi:hypothetical protein